MGASSVAFLANTSCWWHNVQRFVRDNTKITSVRGDSGQYCHDKQTMWPVNSGLLRFLQLPGLKFRLQRGVFVMIVGRELKKSDFQSIKERTMSPSSKISDIQALRSASDGRQRHQSSLQTGLQTVSDLSPTIRTRWLLGLLQLAAVPGYFSHH